MFPDGLLKKMLNALKRDGNDEAYFSSMDLITNKINEGEMLFVSKVVSVLNGADFYIHHVSGSTKYLHSVIEANSIGAWRFTSYSGTTYTDPGDLLDQINRKNDSAYSPEVKFYENVVGDIDVLGTQRLDFTFGSGTNPAKASSGVASEMFKSVFSPDTDVLIKFTNNSGSTQLLSLVFNYYEEE